jgi:hypothetical protein
VLVITDGTHVALKPLEGPSDADCRQVSALAVLPGLSTPDHLWAVLHGVTPDEVSDGLSAVRSLLAMGSL